MSLSLTKALVPWPKIDVAKLIRPFPVGALWLLSGAKASCALTWQDGLDARGW
jgi:hypothetical protein